MATNREVITDALRELTVLDANETASAEDMALGIRVMNRLFALLSADGINLGYAPQTSASEDFPLDSTIEAQIIYPLAVALRIHYPSAVPDQTLFSLANGTIVQLTRAAVLENMEEARAAIPLGSGFTHAYDFDSGE